MATHAATSATDRLGSGTGSDPSAQAATAARIALRPLRATDAGEAHVLFDTHPDVWAFDPGRAYSRSEREAWARIKSCEWETPTGRLGIGCHAITGRDGGRMLGCVGLAASLVPGGLDAEPGAASSLEVELYFRLGRDHWGRGYATEACRMLVRLAFDTLGVRRLFCATSRAHDGALALMRRLDMEIDVRPLPGSFWGRIPRAASCGTRDPFALAGRPSVRRVLTDRTADAYRREITMDSLSRSGLRIDGGQGGADQIAPEAQPLGQFGDVPVQGLAAHDPAVVENAPVVADAQDPVAPPPGPPIAQQVVRPYVPPDKALADEAKGKLVPDKEGLIGLIGKGPKEDTKLFGSFGPTIHRSTHYKAVLGALDAYHALIENSRGLDPTALEVALDASLSDLQRKCEDYLGARFAPNKDAMRGFLESVKEQRAVVQSATALLDGLTDVDHDLSLPEAIGLLQARPDITAADVKSLVEKDLIDLVRANPRLTADDLAFIERMGLDATAVEDKARGVLALVAKIEDALESSLNANADDVGRSTKGADEAKVPGKIGELVGALKQVVDAARQLGVEPEVARAYFEGGVPLTVHTSSQIDLQGELRPFGHGAVNTVYEGTYSRDGVAVTAIFKPVSMLDPGTVVTHGHNADLGISQENPGYALRNLASYMVAEKISPNLLVKTELAVVGGQLYVVMEKAQGLSGSKGGDVFLKLDDDLEKQLETDPEFADLYARLQGWAGLVKVEPGKWKVLGGDPESTKLTVTHDFSNPALRLQLTRLQWLDALTGQVDRHHNNYFVAVGPGGEVVVKGIDNDIAFGALQSKPDVAIGHRPSNLPDVIDRATADAMRELRDDPSELIAKLSLPPKEIEALLSRLDVICAKIDEIERDGNLLETEQDWGPHADGDPVGDLLGIKPAPVSKGQWWEVRDKSYVARDAYLAADAQQKGVSILPDQVA